MDVLDILIAKKKSFTSETEKLVRDANAAMKKAEDATTIAEEATAVAESVSQDLEAMKADISSAAQQIVDTAIQDIENTVVNDVIIEEDNGEKYKGKKAKVRKKNLENSYNIYKNYTTTGNNEDGSMTQKAITEAFNSFTPEKGVDLGEENAGSMVVVDEEGQVSPSVVTEADLIKTQIAAGIYNNTDIVGLELDYVNRTYTRLQGAKDLTPGADFDKFKMFGGRKRCVVNQNGEIIRFVDNNDTSSTLENQRIMVYQPAFYYMRVPLEVVNLTNGTKINKEQIFLSDNKIAGFSLHPIFRDENGNALKYVLLSAFESSAYRTNYGSYEKEDAQNVDLYNDMLVSIINSKPISGLVQSFNGAIAETMAQNNGQGWHITNLEFESMNQMLMMVEFGTPNIQNSFNRGLVDLTLITDVNIACNTGSTLNLGDSSGQASSTIYVQDGTSTTYTDAGKCSISYRGMENPYGNICRFVRDLGVLNGDIIYKGKTLSFKLSTKSEWINGFGYDKDNDWIFLPVETGKNANSLVPVGDYYYAPGNITGTTYGAITGGFSASADNTGLFYCSFTTVKDNFNFRHNSARIMHIPTANSTIETNNYNLWNS